MGIVLRISKWRCVRGRIAPLRIKTARWDRGGDENSPASINARIIQRPTTVSSKVKTEKPKGQQLFNNLYDNYLTVNWQQQNTSVSSALFYFCVIVCVYRACNCDFKKKFGFRIVWMTNSKRIMGSKHRISFIFATTFVGLVLFALQPDLVLARPRANLIRYFFIDQIFWSYKNFCVDFDAKFERK